MARTIFRYHDDAFRAGVLLGANVLMSQITTGTAVNMYEQTAVSHPVVSLLGKYRNDPLWEGFEEALRNIEEEDSHRE